MHVSEPLQTLLSSQSSLPRQQSSTGSPAWHPFAASQVSSPSQNTPLSQINGVPAWHSPVAGLQVSSPLQTVASTHRSSFGVDTQSPSMQFVSTHPEPSIVTEPVMPKAS
jgi:hypothetical protein